MNFTEVALSHGENVVWEETVESSPSSPGYWAKYQSTRGSFYVGPFVCESDAYNSGASSAEFDWVVYLPFPDPPSLRSIDHGESEYPFRLVWAGEDMPRWAVWSKKFNSIKARDEWLEKAGFEVSKEIEGLPIEWSRNE